jgi:hypothetical protein
VKKRESLFSRPIGRGAVDRAVHRGDEEMARRRLVVIGIIVAVGSFLLLQAVWRWSMTDFARRHFEATAGIERVYGYFEQNEHWPAKSVVESPGNQWFPAGWAYEFYPDQGGPSIGLHGPNHMIIAYRFVVPRNGALSASWILSIEGDGNKFDAEAAYAPSPGPPGRARSTLQFR